MEDEDVIRQNMEQTRESLTEKLETLENKLLGSVQEATSAVRETVSSVKETMHEGVESVRDAVNISGHVERHPWLMFGGAIIGGYMLANVLAREKKPTASDSTMAPVKFPLANGNGHREQVVPLPPAKSESWLGTLLEPELRKLKGLALGVALGTVRDMVTKEVPPHLAGQLGSIIDAVTEKVGGEPIASSDLPFSESVRREAEAHTSPFDVEKPRW